MTFAALVSIKDQSTISLGAEEVAKKSVIAEALQCQSDGCKWDNPFFPLSHQNPSQDNVLRIGNLRGINKLPVPALMP